MSPVFLAGLVVQARRCVVIGSDEDAVDRAQRLSEVGAIVERFESPPDDHALASSFLVISTIRDATVSARLFALATAPGGFLLCCIDQPEYCTFTNVAVVRRGPLQLGVATDGGAPMLAARIRAAMDAQLGSDLGAFAARVAQLRTETAAASRRDVMHRALEGFEWLVTYAVPRERIAVEPEHSLRESPDEPRPEQKTTSGKPT